LRIAVRNIGARAVSVRTTNAYAADKTRTLRLAPGAEAIDSWRIAGASHWYDISVVVAEDMRFLRRLAGHIETGRPSRSDPALDWA
jgi:phospholipase C